VSASPGATRELWAARAWLGADAGGFASDVLISCSPAGIITGVEAGVSRADRPAALAVGGDVCLPGFVNAHSHAFHRAMRGVSEAAAGSFWTWRDAMYRVADRLDPDSYRELTCLVYAEMLLAGYTAVGEFHYLHHAAGGATYADPNEMGLSVLAGASAAGIRLTLIDACYLQADIDGSPLSGAQLRFGDRSGEAWSERVSRLTARASVGSPSAGTPPFGDLVHFGVAAHSVRATPAAAIRTVAALAASEDLPLHVHVSEQERENEACLKVAGLTPTDLLHDCGAVTPRTTAVHATHVTTLDLGRLGLASCGVCACPTTARDLGDGIAPFAELAEAGAVLSIGSDSHAVIDPFEETRAIELNERLATQRRGIWGVAALFEAATSGGCRALGWPAGGIRVGSAADVVGVRLDSPRLAGGHGASPAGPLSEPPAGHPIDGTGSGLSPADEELLARILFAASPADVETAVVGGRVVVEGGEHALLGPSRAVAGRMRSAIAAALGAP
jgi:formiminoglutamate deiminase